MTQSFETPHIVWMRFDPMPSQRAAGQAPHTMRPWLGASWGSRRHAGASFCCHCQ